MSNVLLLVDLTNISFRYISKSKNRATNIVSMVGSFKKSFNADYVICVKDCNGSSYRSSIYKEYKQHRYQNKTEEELNNLREFSQDLKTAVTLLEGISIPVIEIEGIEADDIITYLVSKFKDKYDIIILSGDSDLLQLGVTQFSPFKKEFLTLENSDTNTYKLAKAIAGDTADNIKGVYGVGIKTATNILQKYNVKNIDDLFTTLSTLKKLSKKEQDILNNKDLIYNNLKLIDLQQYNHEIITNDIEEKIMKYLKNFMEVI